MRKNFACLLLMCTSITLSAQFSDSFNDGNLTADPAWVGNTADWQIIANSDVAAGSADSKTLRLGVAAGSGVTYLSTQITGNWGTAQSWGFFIGRRGQAYTASNHVLIWLWASEPGLASATVNGYRIRIGDDGGGDEIILQRVTNGVPADILIGAALTNNLTDIGFLLRVTRNNSGNWEVFTSVLPVANGTGAVATDISNSANANVSQGSVTDNTYTTFDNGYIGFVNAYGSSAQARAAQEFDQVQLSFTQSTVPVKLDKFDAAAEGNAIKLSWNASEESGVQHYEVQRSGNGLRFEPIGYVNAESRAKYSFIDSNPGNGEGFYRLRIVDLDGHTRHTHIVGVKTSAGLELKVMPNPATGVVNITHPKVPGGSVLQVLNGSGTLVKELIVPENAVLSVMDVSVLPGGLYHIVFAAIKRQKLYRSLIKK